MSIAEADRLRAIKTFPSLVKYLRDELDWPIEQGAFAIEQMKQTDTLLFGWNTYEMMSKFWPTEQAQKSNPILAEKMNTTAKIAFSKQARKVEWQNTRLISKNALKEVEKLKNEPGKDMCVLGSSNLCVSLIEAGLIDEFQLLYSPVLLGKGHPLYGGIKDRLHLKLQNTKTFSSGNVLMAYKPIK